MKSNGFTLVEQIVVIVILGLLFVATTSVMKPTEIRTEALIKSGVSAFIQVEFATKSMLAKDTRSTNFTRLFDSAGEFSIESADSVDRLVKIYKKRLISKRNSPVSAQYTTPTLTDGTTELTGFSVGSFTGFTTKNDMYFGVKLHGNCTTDVDYLYDPSTPERKTRSKTCGVLFFDVNGEESPNLLGIDQYIVAIGKRGVK